MSEKVAIGLVSSSRPHHVQLGPSHPKSRPTKLWRVVTNKKSRLSQLSPDALSDGYLVGTRCPALSGGGDAIVVGQPG